MWADSAYFSHTPPQFLRVTSAQLDVRREARGVIMHPDTLERRAEARPSCELPILSCFILVSSDFVCVQFARVTYHWLTRAWTFHPPPPSLPCISGGSGVTAAGVNCAQNGPRGSRRRFGLARGSNQRESYRRVNTGGADEAARDANKLRRNV